MAARADIAVYDTRGELALIVDIKNKLGTDDEWATKMRRNLVAHDFLPKVPFFLLALPDRFYLWKDKYLPQLEKPQYGVDASSVLEPYFERASVQPSSITETGFELLIGLWLADLIDMDELPEAYSRDNGWLIQSGLFGAIRHGIIAVEAVV